MLRTHNNGLGGKKIGVESESCDCALADGGNEGCVAYGFAGGDVGDMHLDDGYLYCLDRIGYGQRCVCIGSGVEYYAVAVGSMEGIDDVAFVIALHVFHFVSVEHFTEFHQIGFEGARAVNVRLTGAQEIEVGAVYDKDLHLVSKLEISNNPGEGVSEGDKGVNGDSGEYHHREEEPAHIWPLGIGLPCQPC